MDSKFASIKGNNNYFPIQKVFFIDSQHIKLCKIQILSKSRH